MRALARIGSSSIGRSEMPQINQLAENWYLASQLFWLALIFGAVFVVIGLGMYPKIEATVDARDRKVADDLASAKAAHAAADNMAERYRQQHAAPLRPEERRGSKA